MILGKVLKTDTLGLYDEPKYKNLKDLTVMLIQFWLNEMAEVDTYLL